MSNSETQAFVESHSQDRIDRLSSAQRRVLAWAVMEFRSRRGGGETDITQFFLPFAEQGLDFPQIRALVEKIPAHYPLDHRHIYFDFRLARWMRVLEPPTLRECLEDYLENTPSRAEAMTFIEKECREFFRTHQKPDWSIAGAR